MFSQNEDLLTWWKKWWYYFYQDNKSSFWPQWKAFSESDHVFIMQLFFQYWLVIMTIWMWNSFLIVMDATCKIKARWHFFSTKQSSWILLFLLFQGICYTGFIFIPTTMYAIFLALLKLCSINALNFCIYNNTY